MWKEEIIAKQCKSTQVIMRAQNARPECEDDSYQSRIRLTPIDIKAQCVKEDGTVDLNVRIITPHEERLHTQARQDRGQILEQIKQPRFKTEYKSTLTEEKRENAIHAFMSGFSLETIKNKFKAIMSGIKETIKYGYQARKEE